jgi:hypothetical protein
LVWWQQNDLKIIKVATKRPENHQNGNKMAAETIDLATPFW